MNRYDKSADWNDWKMFKAFILRTHGNYPEIGLLPLNRPDKLNSVNADMVNDINECLDLLMRSFDCRGCGPQPDR
jgi:enoyl-CoA hydratase/carnithine racemase